MNYYKLKLEDNTTRTVKAETTMELIKKYDLASKNHINTTICQLEGEQLALAMETVNK